MHEPGDGDGELLVESSTRFFFWCHLRQEAVYMSFKEENYLQDIAHQRSNCCHPNAYSTKKDTCEGTNRELISTLLNVCIITKKKHINPLF